METRLKNQDDISINSLQLQRHRSKLHDEDEVYLNFTHFIKYVSFYPLVESSHFPQTSENNIDKVSRGFR